MSLSIALAACAVCAAPAPAAPDVVVTPEAAPSVAMDASVDARVGGLAIGAGSEQARIDERRVEARLGVTFVPAVRVWVGVPVLFRSFAREDVDVTSTVLGDVEAGVDATLVDDREGLRERLWIAPLVKFPTAPVAHDPRGEALPSGLQPGCSSVMPALSIFHAFGERFWNVRVFGGLALPFAIRDAPHRGAQVTLGGDFEVRPFPAMTLRLGSRWLLEPSGEGARGETEPDSGGATHYVSAGVDVSIRGQLSAGLGLDAPLGAALRGDQSPSPIVGLRAGGRWEL